MPIEPIVNEVIGNEVIGVFTRIEKSTPYDARVFGNLKRRAKQNGYSLPKQVLVDILKARISRRRLRQLDYVLEISLHNGCGAKYPTFDSIPNESVPCPCGDETHWLIKYTDLTEAENGS